MFNLSSKKLRTGLIVSSVALLGCLGMAVKVYRNIDQPPVDPTSNTTPAPEQTDKPKPETTTTPETTPKPKRVVFQYPHEVVDFSQYDATANPEFASSFALQTSDSSAYTNTTYSEIRVDMDSPGSALDSIMIYRDGIPLASGQNYLIYASVSADTNKNIAIAMVNADDGSTFLQESYSLSPEGQFLEIPFTYNGPNTYNGSLRFYLGQGEATGINLKDIRIVAFNPTVTVRVNQMGYLPLASKRCTFPYNAGDIFDVMDAETNTVVFSGPIQGARNDETSGETNYFGDFSTLNTPGKYYIRAQIGITSPVFEIKENLYNTLTNDAIKMLSLQRCGMALDESWAGALAHAECHTGEAKIYGVEERRDVRGGWHDAGDYGRYVETGTKAVNDLLFSYLYAPEQFGDDIGGPDSNNGIPDILDEARYELDWLLKMQNSDGGVYNTVITDNVSNNVWPNEDDQNLNMLYIESTSTADFFLTNAIAAIAYQDVDPDYANTCKEAAIKAKAYLQTLSQHMEYQNPPEINGGLYLDDDELDSQFSGNLAMWVLTGEDKYLEDAKYFFYLLPDRTCATGISWRTNGGYGRYLFLTNENAKKKDETFYADLLSSLESEANNLMNMANGNAYQVSLFEYPWASNSDVANHGVILSMAYDLLGNEDYLRVATEQLNYLLGKNALETSFISGYGNTYPKHIHSRVALVSDSIIPGAIVGGPDEHRDDKITQEISWDVPPAKVYVDDFESYSTNEIAIIYNSSLIHLLTRINQFN